MRKDEKTKCHAIIHTAASLSAAAATPLSQIPGSDRTVIVPIQTAMIISLGLVFNVKIDELTAKSAFTTAAATEIGRTISQLLIGWIPFFGNAVNATTAFALTEQIGWIAAKEFSRKYNPI